MQLEREKRVEERRKAFAKSAKPSGMTVEETIFLANLTTGKEVLYVPPPPPERSNAGQVGEVTTEEVSESLAPVDVMRHAIYKVSTHLAAGGSITDPDIKEAKQTLASYTECSLALRDLLQITDAEYRRQFERKQEIDYFHPVLVKCRQMIVRTKFFYALQPWLECIEDRLREKYADEDEVEDPYYDEYEHVRQEYGGYGSESPYWLDDE